MTPPSDSAASRAELEPPSDVFDALANRHRRRLLGLVYERAPETVSRDELADSIAGGTDQRPEATPTEERLLTARINLHHVHLPRLDEAGLVELGDGDAVALGDHDAFSDPGVVDVVTGDANAPPGELDALFGSLVDPRRRTVLDVLGHQFQRIRTETLAREVCAAERNVSERAVPSEDVARVLISLRHVHLPRLAAADLVEYDDDEETVTYGGHPALRVPWIHSVLAPDFRGSLTDESDTTGVGTLESRERVVSFGQSLCDRADEELFCMFTETGMLEAGCFTRLRDASRRGVDVYLGTCDPTVREYVREHAPDVVLWEPDTDWLSLPVQDGRVGRLLLADREAVMLGTLDEEGDDGVNEERAIVGEGADNSLVVLLRQLLCPHLEKFDAGSDDVEARLPF